MFKNLRVQYEVILARLGQDNCFRYYYFKYVLLFLELITFKINTQEIQIYY
jgi:hypothetical protein